ncbi:5-oxoprolinase subunit PxpA [Paraglaciecola sp.]|uniref:5-oxoprolinase subunit PxpA n=1 Tax=Paraglaciecola sp. TaxID=1920173 RepID=UPI0030F410E2
MPQHSIDINCDMGEGLSQHDCEQDALLMPYISRCNIACGGHAGNIFTMAQTLNSARHHGLKCGAHPGYPDPDNFGRISIKLSHEQLLDNVLKQIQQLDKIATELGQTLGHIKLHGALYNDAEKSTSLASVLCQALAQDYPNLTVLGLAGGAMQVAAKQHGLTFLREGFMDRAYLVSGQLAPRTLPGAVYQKPQQCIAQVMAILKQTELVTLDGESLLLKVDTLCLHGDSAIALELVKTLHADLIHAGYHIQ